MKIVLEKHKQKIFKGQVYEFDGAFYLLAQIGDKIIEAIDVVDGNRWMNGVRVGDIKDITEEELEEIFNSENGEAPPELVGVFRKEN